MKYMGSKRRIAKHILPIMLKHRSESMTWVEPFVGGANMIDKVEGKRLGADLSHYLIDALISIRDHLSDLPKNNIEFTEADYKTLRKEDTYRHKGYAGFTFSFAGKWLGGWARDPGKRDFVREAYKNALNQSPKIQGVEFKQSDYQNLCIPPNSLIYCDPPYAGTTGYKGDSINRISFWQWCRDKTNEGHVVFISEYCAPSDFKCVWSKEIVSSLDKNTGSKRGIEKLFIYEVLDNE